MRDDKNPCLWKLEPGWYHSPVDFSFGFLLFTDLSGDMDAEAVHRHWIGCHLPLKVMESYLCCSKSPNTSWCFHLSPWFECALIHLSSETHVELIRVVAHGQGMASPRPRAKDQQQKEHVQKLRDVADAAWKLPMMSVLSPRLKNLQPWFSHPKLDYEFAGMFDRQALRDLAVASPSLATFAKSVGETIFPKA